ncbi:MAG: HAD-IA family hydrolase [Candidatus Rokubacteria bacterium]|nr:HAD-IA family hydrolase [Candidatus Rokubacteria bacterium]
MKPASLPKKSRPVRAVFFDAGNTLLRINYAAIAEQLNLHGIRRSHEAVAQAEYRARVRLDPHLAPGASTESHSVAGYYFRYILEGLGITDRQTCQALAQWRTHYNPPVGLWHVPDPEAEAALKLTRATGCAAGVISNSNGSVRSILEETGLAAYLDFILDSAVVGVEKPDPRIFQLALAAARVEPDAAVYIGDLYSVDVLGARRAGLAAVLLDPAGVWGKPDCPTARSLGDAVRLALGR